MKRLYKKALAVLLLLLLLSGCQKPEVQEEIPVITDSTPEKVEEEAAKPQTDLKLITYSSGLINSGCAYNRAGVYLLESDGETVSGHMEYIDFASGKRIYLSNQLDVTFDETNPGWIKDVSGGCVPMADDTHLYFYLGESGGNNPPRFVQADLNGTNRKELVVPELSVVRGGSAVASGGNVLYYLADDYNSVQNGSPAIALYAADFDKMSVERVCEISTASFGFIVGAHENCLLIQSASPTEGLWQTALYDVVNNSYTGQAFLYDLRKTKRIASENTVYYIEESERILKAFDLLTGEERILTDLSSQFDDINSKIYFDQDIYDGRLLISFYKDQNVPYKCFVVDLATGELKDFTLTFEGLFGTEYIRVMAANEKYYFVFNRMEDTKQMRLGEDGEPVERIVEDYAGALIEIENYWNSTAAFIPITDTRNS